MAVQEGDLIRFTIQYLDTQTQMAFDPDEVFFSSRSSQGTDLGTATIETQYDGVTTSPAVGVIARIGLGNFEIFGDATDVWGVSVGKWRSSGNGQKVSFDVCPVDRNLF